VVTVVASTLKVLQIFRISIASHFILGIDNPPTKSGNSTGNRLGTEHPETASNTSYQHPCKPLRSKDRLIILAAHNPEVVGSNPTPATTFLIAVFLRPKFRADIV